MTKFNKIKKSTFAILALSLVLVAVLAFGGTYAYFTDTATATGTVNTGTLTLSDNLVFTTTSGCIVPGQDVLANPVTFDTDGTNIDIILLAKVSIPDVENVIITPAYNTSWEAVTEPAATANATYLAYKGTGDYKLTANNEDDITIVEHVYIDRTTGNLGQNKEVAVTVTVWALQANYLNDVNGGASGDLASANKIYTAFSKYYKVGGATGGESSWVASPVA